MSNIITNIRKTEATHKPSTLIPKRNYSKFIVQDPPIISFAFQSAITRYKRPRP